MREHRRLDDDLAEQLELPVLDNLHDGFVNRVASRIKGEFPQYRIKVVNSGQSVPDGNRVLGSSFLNGFRQDVDSCVGLCCELIRIRAVRLA